ncbi:MAG: tRNA dihydrouridine synthase DusB [Pseudomonadota bacterium]
MLRIGEIEITPNVLLAPMAGLTDRPFRDLVASFGAGLVVSEMVATAEWLADHAGTRAKTEIAAGARASAVQLMGRDPARMAEAARRLAGEGAQIIDINMGCPARKVTTGAAGSALMREPALALEIIEAVVEASAVPVTVKMRLGWDEETVSAPELAMSAESVGVQMITVHGRTRCQFYRGEADWAAIRAVVEAVSIPVIANGDVVNTTTARRALQLSGAAGVMVGRGATGRPWRLAQIAADLAGAPPIEDPSADRIADIAIAHYEATLGFYGIEPGLRCARKHLDAYLKQLPGGPEARPRLIRSTDPREVISGLRALGACETPRGLAA